MGAPGAICRSLPFPARGRGVAQHVMSISYLTPQRKVAALPQYGAPIPGRSKEYTQRPSLVAVESSSEIPSRVPASILAVELSHGPLMLLGKRLL